MSTDQESLDTSYKKRLERARELSENKNYEEASALYHQLIDEAKENKDDPLILWVELAWIYYYLKRFESTIICLNQVVAHADEYEKMVESLSVEELLKQSHCTLDSLTFDGDSSADSPEDQQTFFTVSTDAH